MPAALNTRAKQEGPCNDKKYRLALRESDRLIVASRKAQAPTLEKGPTGTNTKAKGQVVAQAA